MDLGYSISIALGGLGLFLVAVKIMSSSMKSMSSGFTAKMLHKMTTNKWLGLLFGICFTTMIQSSDGAVALTIGLIGAGMLTLKGAIPLILGANIGTATTAVIVALGGASSASLDFVKYFMLLAFLGAMILLFVKEDRKVNIAMLIFAIGAIFLGLKVMGIGMKNITHEGWFHSAVSAVGGNPWTALLSNTGLTGLVQSSSATVTVVQNIYSVNNDGLVSMGLPSAIAMVIGANIGTTFTALIASIGGHRDARRIAVVWLVTNLLMALTIMPIIGYYGDMINEMQSVKSDVSSIQSTILNNGGYAHLNAATKTAIDTKIANVNSTMKFQLAWAHLIFNTAMVAIFIWLTKPLEWAAMKIVPNKKSRFKYDINLPKSLINEAPDLAFEAAEKATVGLSRMSQDALILIREYVEDKNPKHYSELKDLMNLIETTRSSLYAYLIEIGSHDISRRTANRHLSLVLASRSLERIPLIGKELAKEIKSTEKRGRFDIAEKDYDELLTLLKVVSKITEKSAKQLSRFSKTRSQDIRELNDYLDTMVSDNSQNHVKRKEVTKFDYLLALKLISRMSHHAARVNKYIARGKEKFETARLSDKLKQEVLEDL